MLHEVLLALSGHPSPLFPATNSTQEYQSSGQEELALLTPPERALLRSIGELADLHSRLRQHLAEIVAEHRSTICRAVATSIRQKHLDRFQKKIVDVENRILTKDASIVGAYEIVPLASVVEEFDDWHRLMAWYWQTVCHMRGTSQGSAQSRSRAACTGASMIDLLREEQQTGFPEIEAAAIDLSKVAETAWLRQLASWVVYGTLPTHGGNDFFIQASGGGEEKDTRFTKEKDLLPRFVTPSTASSILFIGRSLHQVREYGKGSSPKSSSALNLTSENELVSKHLQMLSTVCFPIVPAQLSRTVTAIRLSFSQNVLQHLLPMDMTLDLLACMKQFFLLSRGDFAFTLITEAESRLQTRQLSMGKLLQQDPAKALQSLAIKDAEMHQTLSLALRALAMQNAEDEDAILEFARSNVTLCGHGGAESRPTSSDSSYDTFSTIAAVAFDDLLFPTTARLKLDIPEPLDLFFSPRDAESYSSINSYLLAIERAYLRLSDLWKRTPARRDQTNSSAVSGEARARQKVRRVATRKIWATCSAAVFLLSETARYLESEILRESWDVFEQWIKPEPSRTVPKLSDGVDNGESPSDNSSSQKDPETLASGHRTFLAALIYSLLLTDVAYTRSLRSLLGNVDNLIAFFSSLLDLQQKLDLELAAGGETGHTISEERRIALELDRARKKVDSDLKSVVSRLRQLDHERIGAGRYLDVGVSESGFQPWKGGGVDRLLMKLEFGRMASADSSEGGDDLLALTIA